MSKRIFQRIAIGLPLCFLLALGVYFLPPVQERLAWRVDVFKSQVYYWFKPPEKEVFVPQGQSAAASPTPSMTPSAAPTASPTAAATATGTAAAAATQPTPTPGGPTATLTPTNTLTPSPTVIPPRVQLKGVIHEYQKWNNCGPSTLSMALSFWGWKGTQMDVAAVIKPNPRDKNVMPYEMETFVEENAGLQALVRVGGTLELLKRLVAAGFPVVIERGFEVSGHGWMGHYEVVTGYDDGKKAFITQDSYIMPDLPVPYTEMAAYWQQFNYIYLVIYPAERESELLALLGADADETVNFQNAAQLASNEIFSLEEPARYYAWYNRGTNLVRLQDYAGGAAAYDEAFKIYPSIPEKQRPWRMIWYQTGPYFAYFYSGRSYDVINLATTAILSTDEPAFEETWYWRAMAKNALGDSDGAVEDLRVSLKWHPDFAPSLQLLAALGVQP